MQHLKLLKNNKKEKVSRFMDFKSAVTPFPYQSKNKKPPVFRGLIKQIYPFPLTIAESKATSEMSTTLSPLRSAAEILSSSLIPLT